MRLDHLLSKEKMAVEETAGLLRSGRSQARKRFALFNLEGTRTIAHPGNLLSLGV